MLYTAIQKTRKRRGLSQEDLAKQLGMSLESYQKLEQEETKTIKILDLLQEIIQIATEQNINNVELEL